MRKVFKKCALKTVPDPSLILLNNPKHLINARSSFENKKFSKTL